MPLDRIIIDLCPQGIICKGWWIIRIAIWHGVEVGVGGRGELFTQSEKKTQNGIYVTNSNSRPTVFICLHRQETATTLQNRKCKINDCEPIARFKVSERNQSSKDLAIR